MLIEKSFFDSAKIGFDGECVTQIVSELPEEVLLRQACYLLFKRIEQGTTLLRRPELEFLLLLSGEKEIRRAKERLGVRKEGYLVTCCKDELYSREVKIENRVTRIALSRNALFIL
ncbi:hypothetical protein HS1genome_0003 [Sulfodiicoccus acidiphilus]|uniref:Uncharacterized protein n=1 Tax=Sulfodiicoccus acidiphilus TaxID=1670455 RepID=A0A348B0B2_9CREN|nr:hypothetical protein [Sulfodiicoccus acidiphilus]BBD71614.1 hypothetical protein HS1genome_0003 [Sulfodiicoccus acidiphilus]GGT87081.1 hypothetical protein GCM10007116_01400 [Sulfodiicoccus acidiphilus]